jgi:hypothetical protein
MFNKSIDERLSAWSLHRKNLDNSQDPFMETWEFWKSAPYIPINNKIEPFNSASWPTPWEFIAENKYDDFSKALMIGWSLKFTNRFKNAKIEIKTLVNTHTSCYYNIVYIDDTWAINYSDNGPVLAKEVPELFYLENYIKVDVPK